MIGKKGLLNDFQTFFISKELCISPIQSEIIEFYNKICERKLGEVKFSISHSYGKRILINSKDINVEKLEQDDILEIVDYDPFKNIVIAIGKKYPSIDTPFHWMIQYARYDINAIVIIYSRKLYEICSSQFPVIEYEKSYNTIDKVKLILKRLQDSKIICIKEGEILLTGLQLKDVEKSIMIIFEDLI